MKSKKSTKLRCLQLLICVIMSVYCTHSFAKDLYVSTSGSDSITYENNNISNPWASPKKAWYNAQAGDIVYFRAGTYTISSEIDTSISGYDGTETNPITFTNYQNEFVTFGCGTLDPVFDIEKNWNIVDGITFDGGQTVFRIGNNTPVVGFTIRKCMSHMSVSTDNHGFVYVQIRGKDTTVQNCTIQGPGAAVNTNVSGLIIFGAPGFKALHNEIYDVPRGIYYKHANNPESGDTGIEIAYNYIHDTGHQAIFLNCNYASIHDNLIGLNNGPIWVNSGNGAAGGDYNAIVHNTLYAATIILDDDEGGAVKNTVTNNIFMRSFEAHRYSSIPHYTAMDHNLYVTGSAVIEDRTNYSLSTWKTHNGSDAFSEAGGPAFVGGVSPSSISDFALASGSLGKNAGSDGKDMGADISLVGPQAGKAPPDGSAPNTPLVDCLDIVQGDFGPEIIFHDEFEDSTPMSEKYADYNSNNGDCDVTDTAGYGGSSRSLMASWQQSQVNAGSFAYMFGRNPYVSQSQSDTDFREIYWRLYLKTSKGWMGNARKLTRATIFASANWAQAMIAHVWGASDNLLLRLDPASGIDGNDNLATTKYNDFDNLSWLGVTAGTTEIYDTSLSNSWYCVEAHVRLNTPGSSDGVFEFWIDGNLEARRDNLNWVGNWEEYGINTIMFANYINEGAPQAQERFIDNIVISTERIGLSPSPVNPIIFKTAFEDPDAGDTQSAFQSQVSTTPDTTGLVWTGEISGSANTIKVDIQDGSFQGTLSGKTSLDAEKYYVRVRHADNSGNYSSWSPWKPFRAGEINPLSKPDSPKNLRVVQ